MFLLYWAKLIFVYLAVFQWTRYLIRMISVILLDILAFMIILVITMLAFTHIMFLLLKETDLVQAVEEDGVTKSDEISRLSIDAYAITFGELAFEDLNAMQYIMFVVFSFAITLVLMNMLIAIMTDSYEKV